MEVSMEIPQKILELTFGLEVLLLGTYTKSKDNNFINGMWKNGERGQKLKDLETISIRKTENRIFFVNSD